MKPRLRDHLATFAARAQLLEAATEEMNRRHIPMRQRWRWLQKYAPAALLATVAGGAQTASYIVYNSALVTTAAPVKQPTGTALRTMMLLKPNANAVIRPIVWGCSFDGAAAATPGQIELVETGTVFPTMSTAYVNADIQRYGNSAGPAQGDIRNYPIDVTGTATAGFATAAVTEGSTTVTRMADMQMVAPTNQYVYQWPLGREFECAKGGACRLRVTFGTTVNMWAFIIFEA